MSGGRATLAYRKGTRLASQAGDITAIDTAGEPLTRQFLLEIKHYRNLQFAGLLIGTGELSKFWKKLKDDSASYGKLPMLIARQNSYPTIACLDRKGLDVLVLKFACVLTAPKLNLYAVPFTELLINGKRPNGTS